MACDTRYEAFDALARRKFRDMLRAWLRQAPRRVEGMVGDGHRIYIRWHACEERERTTGVAVLKTRSDHDDVSKPLKRLNNLKNRIIHADGCNGYFLFAFYRRPTASRRHVELPIELL